MDERLALLEGKITEIGEGMAKSREDISHQVSDLTKVLGRGLKELRGGWISFLLGLMK